MLVNFACSRSSYQSKICNLRASLKIALLLIITIFHESSLDKDTLLLLFLTFIF